ncbi:MAG: mandelate racemase [Euzebyales bacterium]|nr:mandelate racemase [Euzebyales bacterium]
MTVERLDVSVYTIPTLKPESDGTLAWDRTTVVVVEAVSGTVTGLGFSYATPACATVIHDVLESVVVGTDPMDPPGTWQAMVDAIRNLGRPGVVSMAIAAVDTALWDLKARLLQLPLARLLGMVRSSVPVYGSGGFTSLPIAELTQQLSGWVHADGIPRVKMKIGLDKGRQARTDLERVASVRAAIGDDADLYVDANGAYTAKVSLRMATRMAAEGVCWFEEPVSSDDLAGLRQVRDGTTLDVAAGEYGYDLAYFSRMCAAGAVDVLQADVSRCAGITEWLRAAAVAAAYGLEISGHTAQSLHAHPACAVPNLRHLEYFSDHARVDRLIFDGVLEPAAGRLTLDLTRPGMGLDLKHSDAVTYRV